MVVACVEQLGDPVTPVRLVEVLGDQVGVAGRLDVVVRGGDPAAFRIELPRQVLGCDPARSTRGRRSQPGTGRVPSPARADGMTPRALVADVAVDVGIDEVLSGALDLQHRRAERGERRWPAPPRARATAAAWRRGRSNAARTCGRAAGSACAAGPATPWVRIGPCRDLADGQRTGLGLAAYGDRLVVDGEGCPPLGGLRGRAVVVQALFVEVGHVAGDVGGAPGVVRRRAEEDPGGERRGDAARLVAGRAQARARARCRAG